MAHAKKPHAQLGGRRAQRKGGMTVQNIKRFVEHVKMDHEERLQDIRIQMKSLPPGDLIFARKNQKYYCVQKLNDQRFGITRDQQLVQGLGAATLTLDQDSTVTLDGETVILRAGRQRLDSRLSMALFQSGSNHAGELAAAWCGVFCQSAEELGSEELFTRLNGGFETDLSYAEIARHIQGLGWLGEAKVPAQAADPDDPAGITALFARSEGTNR